MWRCSSSLNALECLAAIYTQCHLEKDHDPVIRGHLAILFGLLMEGHPPNQVVLLRALPGPSSKKKVRTLTENVREFTLFYEEFMKKVMALTRQEDSDEGESRSDFNIESQLRDSHGDAVVKQVLSFFEDLATNVDE